MDKMGLIRIRALPEGTAPLWVRGSWVGLTLPCHPIMGYPANGKPEKDVLTGGPVKYEGTNRCSVSVPQKEALDILAKVNPAAAQWWRSKGFPKPTPDDYFSFGENEVEIVSGVEHQEIRQHLGILEIGR